MSVATTLDETYAAFEPLEPIFASPHGVLALVTNQDRLRQFVGIVRDLLASAADVRHISEALGELAGAFTDLHSLLQGELAKLPGRHRRLAAVPDPDDGYAFLLGGLHFQELASTFQRLSNSSSILADRFEEARSTLDPLLGGLARRPASRRLLGLEEARRGQEAYEQAFLSILPAWQGTENTTLESCRQIGAFLGETRSLQCRLTNFARHEELPGVGAVANLVQVCDHSFNHAGNESDCPAPHSAAHVRTLLAEGAGLIGWICLLFEYAVAYSTGVRVLVAVLCLALPGAFLWSLGYRCRGCEFWVEGFLAGFVVSSAVISVLVVALGVCRDESFAACDVRAAFAVVLITSFLWAGLAGACQRCQLFMAGFDLGAVLGGVIYVSQRYVEIIDSVVDPEDAKLEMSLFLLTAIGVGLAIGALTVYLERPTVVFTTSAIGAGLLVAALVVVSPLLGVGHDLGWPDLILTLLLTIIGVLFQYYVTRPADSAGGAKRGWEEDQDTPLMYNTYYSGSNTTRTATISSHTGTIAPPPPRQYRGIIDCCCCNGGSRLHH